MSKVAIKILTGKCDGNNLLQHELLSDHVKLTDAVRGEAHYITHSLKHGVTMA